MRATDISIKVGKAGGRDIYVDGYSRHGDWTKGNAFYYDGVRYVFIGKDRAGGLWAKRSTDARNVVFDSSFHWKAV